MMCCMVSLVPSVSHWSCTNLIWIMLRAVLTGTEVIKAVMSYEIIHSPG